MDKDYNLHYTLNAKVDRDNLVIQRILGNHAESILIEYQKFTDDFIYKNLPIKILKQMKKRINEELKARKK